MNNKSEETQGTSIMGSTVVIDPKRLTEADKKRLSELSEGRESAKGINPFDLSIKKFP